MDKLGCLELGIFEGLGVVYNDEKVSVLGTQTLNKYLINVLNFVSSDCDVKDKISNEIDIFANLDNTITRDYSFNLLNITATEYANLLGNLNLEDGSLQKFVWWFINSNAIRVDDFITLSVYNSYVNKDFILKALDLVLPPASLKMNVQDAVILNYTYPESLDLLNLGNLLNINNIVLREDLEIFRLALGANLETIDCQSWSPEELKSICSIKFQKLDPAAVIPSKVRSSDSGFDVTLIKHIKTVGDVHFFGTGLAVTPPKGFYLELVPRSSISKQPLMLANSVGIIDSTYRGEIIVPIRFMPNNQFKIGYTELISTNDCTAGTFTSETSNNITPTFNLYETLNLKLPCKLFQLIPKRMYHFDVIEVESLNDTARNSGGFGSTGT